VIYITIWRFPSCAATLLMRLKKPVSGRMVISRQCLSRHLGVELVFAFGVNPAVDSTAAPE
jgi:hypothetical protein